MEALLGVETETAAVSDRDKAGKLTLTATINERPIAFTATEIEGIQHYHPDELKSVPDTLPREASVCCKGLLAWNKKHIAVLDETIVSEQLIRSLQ